MERKELSGVVLTHADRDPSRLITQLSTICGQIILINDQRYGEFNVSNLASHDDTELDVTDRSFDTFPFQRNAGIEKALGSWVLSMDSDEVLSDALLEELHELEPPEGIDAYLIPREERFMNKAMKKSHPYGSLHPRLFRSTLRYAETPVVHEVLGDLTPERTGVLNENFIHEPTESLRELYKKAYGYGQLSTQSGQSPFSRIKIASTLPNFTLRHGFWKDGVKGAMLAGIQMAYRMGTRK